MIIVKLFVLLLFTAINPCYSEYCEICTNHTLCKYPLPGPGPSCVSYDNAALLTTDDVESIVNKINERRNFVALGLLKYLPQAANMRMISWSEDLAWSAQRWVDQCDPSVHPDRLDYCRNLEDMDVGQNIATIFGAAPGLNVKSFVDIWFMDSLEYSGSVSFYNGSRDQKTIFFTQLIWADTDAVGCGKAKFYLQYRNTVVERLVCNFAIKGNIHGKPVYAIGFAATQCPPSYEPDEQYTGLCRKQIRRNEKEITLRNTPFRSLLKILNLSNNSVEHDLDPTRNNFFKKADASNDRRRQKIRHVPQNVFPGITPFIPHPSPWNSSRNYIHERGHSRVYHGHNHRKNFVHATASNIQDLIRYDFTNELATATSITSDVQRKTNQYNPCSRDFSTNGNPCSVLPCESNQCTRVQGCGTPLCLPSSQIPNTDPHSECPCSTEINCQLTTSRYHCCDLECCPCSLSTTCHPEIARRQDDPKHETKKSDLHYYDLFPNRAMRSGDTPIERLPKKRNLFSNKRPQMLRKLVNKAGNKDKDIIIPIKTNYFEGSDRQNTNGFDNRQNEYDYSYDTFDSNERQRRWNEEQSTFRPSNLQVSYDDRINNPFQKKVRRFTTLSSKRNIKSSRSISKIKTEPITIRLTKPDGVRDRSVHSTETFLSFEELMRLKKNNAETPNYRRMDQNQEHDIMRANKPATKPTKPTTKPTKPPETKKTEAPKPDESKAENYTTVPPFINESHCTRKVTCTWTQMPKTDKDGNIIGDGGSGGKGSGGSGGGFRTPLGYVKGCTRTVTCTRIYFERNKQDHINTELPGAREGTTDGPAENDEDYCERRSLDIRRRDSDKEDEIESVSQNNELVDYNKGNISSEINVDDCSCNNGCSRKKRELRKRNNCLRHLSCNQNCDQRKEPQYKNPLMSYGDLYYSVLNKLVKSWENKKCTSHSGKCPCNNSVRECPSSMYLVLFILYTMF